MTFCGIGSLSGQRSDRVDQRRFASPRPSSRAPIAANRTERTSSGTPFLDNAVPPKELAYVVVRRVRRKGVTGAVVALWDYKPDLGSLRPDRQPISCCLAHR